jgi:hypothetical protein
MGTLPWVELQKTLNLIHTTATSYTSVGYTLQVVEYALGLLPVERKPVLTPTQATYNGEQVKVLPPCLSSLMLAKLKLESPSLCFPDDTAIHDEASSDVEYIGSTHTLVLPHPETKKMQRTGAQAEHWRLFLTSHQTSDKGFIPADAHEPEH